jgi:formylglycine-generating enzyme required for sulfatase activity
MARALLCCCLFFVTLQAVAEGPLVRAFPGAEGFGAATPGGRNGALHFVTTLEDYLPGEEAPIPGSFRIAANAQGPRYILFRVSGTIALKTDLHIREPFLTVAGQIAPGDGICFSDHMVVINTHDVVLRHLRFRSGDRPKEEQLTVGIFGGNSSIIDHCSMTWATDEVMSCFGSVHNLTLQWCIIAEGLSRSCHPKGEHSKGSILNGDGGISIHHSIYAHNSARNPRVDTVVLDFRNNIVYNWGYRGGYTTEGPSYINYVANYLRAGPSTRDATADNVFDAGDDMLRIYFKDNYLEGDAAHTADNGLLLDLPNGADEDAFLGTVLVDRPFRVPVGNTDAPLRARDRVLEDAGATLPKRDSADERLMKEIASGMGRIIDSQDEVGGWPKLKTGPIPMDTDNDGMPDVWESAHGLDADSPEDYVVDTDKDGYPNLEEFLNNTDPMTPEPDCTLPANTFRTIQELALARSAQGKAEFKTWKIAGELDRIEARNTDLQTLDVEIVYGDDGKRATVHLGDRATIDLVRIPAGTFFMGSPESEGGEANERPQHEVTISQPFYMAATLVTNRQFAALFGPTTERRARNGEEDFPAHEVDWFEATEYCRLLSEKTNRAFRLPTEAEWEYACRAGTTTAFYTGDTISTDQANFDGQVASPLNSPGESRGKVIPVASLPPNPWGLYDMHGNQAEYCQDVAYRVYTEEPVTDPVNAAPTGARVLRGGKASSKPFYIRSAYRYAYAPEVGYGFRVVMESDQDLNRPGEL